MLLGSITYRIVSNMLIQQSKSDAMALAKVAAIEIDGGAFASIQSSEDKNFADVFDKFSKYKERRMTENE